jgi:hypothetical protein
VVALLVGIAALVGRGAPAAAEDPPVGEVQASAPDLDPNFEVDSMLSVSRYAFSNVPGAPGTSGNQETLSTNMTTFATPLRDDDSPYSIQGYMQRESTFSLSLNGGRFDTANPYGGPDQTEWYTGLEADFDAYAKRWLAVFGGASYEYSDLHNGGAARTSHSFAGHLGVGFRVRTTRLDLSAGESGARTAGAFSSWRGNLSLSATTVLGRRVSLHAAGTLVAGGGQGSFSAEVFPSKRAGVFASGFAARTEPYTNPVVVTRYGGNVGFAGWFDSTTALVARYALTYETAPATPQVTPGYDELTHTFQLEAYVRFP